MWENPFNSFGYNYFGSQTYGGTYQFNPLSYEQNTLLGSTLATAKAEGNSKLITVLDYIFKYGTQALELFIKYKVSTSKDALLRGQIDSERLDEILKNNGGTLPPPPQVRNAPETLFGIPTSTLIIILLGVLVYLLVRKPKTSKRR